MVEHDEFSSAERWMIQHDPSAKREEVVSYLAEVRFRAASRGAALRVAGARYRVVLA